MKFSKIYTGKGNRGTTSLFRGGRVSKTDIRVRVMCEMDALNAEIGCAGFENTELRHSVQKSLMHIMTRLATINIPGFEAELQRSNKFSANMFHELSQSYNDLGAELDKLKPEGQTDWVIYGDNEKSAKYYRLSTIVRKSEIAIIDAHKNASTIVNYDDLSYMNLLSKYMYLMGSWAEIDMNQIFQKKTNVPATSKKMG